MHHKTIAELAACLRRGEFTSTDLTRCYLARIERLDPHLNSYISVDAEGALRAAGRADVRLSRGEGGLLTGIPIAHKDIFCTKGLKTSCGSRMLDSFIAPYDAAVVERLEQAGAVMLGKTNMDEFAMGSSNETSFYGPVRNPWDLQRVPGGSSGGSAAAVAARLCAAATATDTGGSIRQPASFCGVTGIKPTYGRVSRYGIIAYGSSLDQGGVIARTAEDCALILHAMAGFDPRDSNSVERSVPDYPAGLDTDIAGLRIGIPEEWLGIGLDPAIAAVVTAALTRFEAMGARVERIRLPHNTLCIAGYYVIAMSEASSNLARYDGVRFGHRCQDPIDLTDLYRRSRAEGLGDEVKRRIMIGTYALSAGYYDAYYLKAQKLRRLIADDFHQAFEQVDVIIGPVAPTPAFPLGAKTNDPVQMYLGDIYTLSINLVGLPGLSIPAGFSADLPVGLQLIGNYWDEIRLLAIAHQWQQTTDWHRAAPDFDLES